MSTLPVNQENGMEGMGTISTCFLVKNTDTRGTVLETDPLAIRFGG